MTTQPGQTDQQPTAEKPAPDTTALTGTHTTVWDALTQQPGTTAAALAEATGIGRSTAAKALARLEKDGRVRRDPGTPDGNRRVASHWYPTHPAPLHTNTPEAQTSDPHDSQELPTAAPDTPTSPAPDEDSAHEAPAETETSIRSKESTEPAQIDSATAEDAPCETAESASAAREESAAPKLTVVTGGSKQRLAPGGLRQMVLDHLQAHPDGEFTATALSRVIGKSSGAIANALVTLEKHGQARQVNDHPRRYQLRTSIEQ
ncbi:MarR family transcriptional regulator [Streptantibioticus ferralitis]|uniref:MarR family transcriptional regulator n=1 Tax=Streptantibioticus ferralitis TaxID=236510 RepID=A0ABT5Z1I4_9ACTN|nr:MarR family transcriptional regulator [Streptantibioticus ferralitis]MDF2257692.1 MarR family transcriptional regulator [Streptantibioticus ferralitis]